MSEVKRERMTDEEFEQWHRQYWDVQLPADVRNDMAGCETAWRAQGLTGPGSAGISEIR
jgi:hypothetical protein